MKIFSTKHSLSFVHFQFIHLCKIAVKKKLDTKIHEQNKKNIKMI